MTGMSATLQELIMRPLDALEAKAKARGERWSVRSLEAAHGIANGTLGAIAKGRRKSVDGPTAVKIAKALGLDVEQIHAAQLGEESPEQERTPPISSGVVVREEHLELLDLAFDPETHIPSDLGAVQTMLRERAALVVPGVDAPQIVRRWLDAAARIRQRGEKADTSKIIAELTARIVELEGERKPPHPLIKAAQERRKKRREE